MKKTHSVLPYYLALGLAHVPVFSMTDDQGGGPDSGDNGDDEDEGDDENDESEAGED